MGWKRENSLKLEKIWQLWRKIMKKLEWILLKEKKMKEKDTKHHEKKICIIIEIIFFQILSCQFNLSKLKPRNKTRSFFSFSPIESQFKLKLSRSLNNFFVLKSLQSMFFEIRSLLFI